MLDLPRSHPWLEREIAGAGRELSQVSQFCGTGQGSTCGSHKNPSGLVRHAVLAPERRRSISDDRWHVDFGLGPDLYFI